MLVCFSSLRHCETKRVIARSRRLRGNLWNCVLPSQDCRVALLLAVTSQGACGDETAALRSQWRVRCLAVTRSPRRRNVRLLVMTIPFLRHCEGFYIPTSLRGVKRRGNLFPYLVIAKRQRRCGNLWNGVLRSQDHRVGGISASSWWRLWGASQDCRASLAVTRQGEKDIKKRLWFPKDAFLCFKPNVDYGVCVCVSSHVIFSITLPLTIS